MSYKRVIKKGGKVYGPYVYESYRDKTGKVRKRYLGKSKEVGRDLKFLFLVFFLAAAIVFFITSYPTFFYPGFSFFKEPYGSSFLKALESPVTGLVPLDVGGDENKKEPAEEKASPKKEPSKEKESKSTKSSEPSGEKKEPEGKKKESSKEKSKDEPLSEKKEPEKIKEEKAGGDSGEKEEGKPKDEPKEKSGKEENKTKKEPFNETKEKEPEKKEENKTKKEEPENKTKKELFNETKEKEPEKKEENKTTTENKTEENKTSEFNASLPFNYSNYTTNLSKKTNETNISINLSNLTKINASLNLSNITLNLSEENKSKNLTLNESLNLTLNESLNLTLNETLNATNITNLSFEIVQAKAIIGRPVKWIKKINSSKDWPKVKLPKKAKNISIITGAEVERSLKEIEDFEEMVEKSDKEEILKGDITGNVALDLDKRKGVLTKLAEWVRDFFSGLTISGNVILENQIEPFIQNESDGKVIDLTGVPVNPNSTEVAVEYYTDPPMAKEIKKESEKEVVIYAPDELNYTDVLAYTVFDLDKISINDTRLKVYWNGEENNKTKRVAVNFTKKDLDLDGFVDYVEWIVPHLSNQSYSVVIEITAAEHLDSNRTFISDIYNETRALDSNWSEPIYSGEYVRVTFEENLTSENDITVYIDSGNNTDLSSMGLEVYLYNGSKVVARFPKFDNGSKYYKVYLTNMSGEHDRFDLRVVGNSSNDSLIFDHIIDPVGGAPSLSNINLTSSSGNDVTSDNLTVTFDASDTDPVYNVTDWRVNGVSIMVANLPFETNVSNYSGSYVYDHSTYQTNGTLGWGAASRAPAWNSTNGIVGGFYTFDGTDDEIVIQNTSIGVFPTSNITVMAWVNLRSHKSYNEILRHPSWWTASKCAWVLEGDASNIAFGVGCDQGNPSVWAGTSNSNVQLGKWVHLAGTYNGTTAKLYINGTEFASATNSTYQVNYTDSSYIHLGTSWGSPDGSIDQVKIFDRALSPEQIKAIYDDEKNGRANTKLFSGETKQDENWTVSVSASDLTDMTTSLSNGVYILDKLYKLNITDPLGSNPKKVSAGENFSLSFLFTGDGSNLTSGVDFDNATVGGLEATIIRWPDNETGRTCTGYWGSNCNLSCSSESDNTFDSCTSCQVTVNEEKVLNVYVNATEVDIGKEVNVTCEFDPFDSSSVEEIWVYSSASGSWSPIYGPNNPSSGAVHNVSATFSDTSLAGNYWARCVVYDSSGISESGCADLFALDYDHDDVNFSVKDQRQFEWISGSGWVANVTAPSGLTGRQDLYVEATYTNTGGFPKRSDTETNAVTYVGDPAPSKFEIKNKSGSVVAAIDSKGDMYLRGKVYPSQSSLSPTPNSFIIKNKTGTVIDYFNSTGSLFLLGAVTTGSVSGMTSTNLEIRNKSGSVVAFFDNIGNLKLKGGYIENYEF